MLTISNISVVETLRKFKKVDLSVCFLVPTETGLNKSIMDATKSLREYFSKYEIHDFEKQPKGMQSKVLLSTILISGNAIIETKTSLYRPETKNGDPRIWIYKLGDYAQAGDLISFSSSNGIIIAVNCSKSNLDDLLNKNSINFSKYFANSINSLSKNANELLLRLKEISSKGYIKTLRAGDTGVGFTLESLLDIPANSNKAPDFKGIEIKSSRKKFQKSSGRSTIFSQVPNWKISRLKGSKEILLTRGKYHEQKKRMQLFHEFSALKINSYNMKLLLDHNKDLLHQIYLKDESSVIDVTWEIEVLKRRLREKHKETFWVSAMTKGKNGDVNEEFLFSEVKHTGEVDFNIFPTLIETGVITLDYTIKEAKKNVAKDQGYLFKISSKNLDLLFSKISHYSLA